MKSNSFIQQKNVCTYHIPVIAYSAKDLEMN